MQGLSDEESLRLQGGLDDLDAISYMGEGFPVDAGRAFLVAAAGLEWCC